MARALATLLSIVACACGSREKPKPPVRPRPVTVMVLADRAPLRPIRVPGSVVAWREDDVAFEVNGRIVEMVELGTYLDGQWREGGKIERQGEVLARVDPEPYEIARDTAQANLDVARSEVETARIRLDRVLPAQEKAAAAQLVRAQAEFERNKAARERNAVSEVDLIRATADRDTRAAKIEEVKAAIEEQKATIEALEAGVKQAEQALRQAQLDVDNCTLYAPFDGEVSQLYSVAGGYARTGSRVAHVVMMDPVKVDFALSSESAARISLGDSVNLLLPGDSEPTVGFVIEKATTANPETRTFRVSVFARNWLQIPNVPAGDKRLEKTRIARFQYVVREHAFSGVGPYLIEETRALRKDAEGAYVWLMVGYKQGQPIRTGALIPLRKVRVEPTDYVRNMQGIMRFRGISDSGDLEAGSMVAWGVPDDFPGGEVLLAQEQWKLRPGQVLSAILQKDVPPAGHWVPLRALRTDDGKAGKVYVVADDVVHIVDVRIAEDISDVFRVEAVDEKGRQHLRPGARLVVDYIHFLSDGEPVQVTRTREVAR